MQKTKTQYRFLISFFSLVISGFLFSDTVFAACSIRGTAYNDFECTGDSSKPSCSSSEIEGTPAFIDCNSGSSGGMGATCCVSKSLVKCEDGGTKCDAGKTCQGGLCVDGGGSGGNLVNCTGAFFCQKTCSPPSITGDSPCATGNGSEVGVCCTSGSGGGGTPPPPGGGTPPPPSTGGSRGWNPGELHSIFPGLSIQPIQDIIENLVQWFLYIIGFLAIIAFIVSAIQYFMAGADEDMAKKAKSSMLYAIIGVIVALSGLVIIYAIDTILNAGGSI